jgi:hypothetical protein
MKSPISCPKCGSRPMRRFELPNWQLVHWVLNPGLAFNELILGQRLPRLTLICDACDDPLAYRQYIPCPNCGVLHNVQSWGKRHAFGNWLGLPCPSCHRRIPCLWNATSILLLLVLFPIWYLPYRFYFRDRPIAAFRPNEKNRTSELKPRWAMRAGILFGALMFLFMSVVPSIVRYVHTGQVVAFELIIGTLLWSLGGVTFGVAMHLLVSRRGVRGRRG